MRQGLRGILDKMGWMLGGTYARRANAINQIHETLAEVCEQYQKQAEQQPPDWVDWVDWAETLAQFLPSLWEMAGYDYDKMEALLKQQIVLGRYFDMLSPEVVAVMECEHD